MSHQALIVPGYPDALEFASIRSVRDSGVVGILRTAELVTCYSHEAYFPDSVLIGGSADALVWLHEWESVGVTKLDFLKSRNLEASIGSLPNGYWGLVFCKSVNFRIYSLSAILLSD